MLRAASLAVILFSVVTPITVLLIRNWRRSLPPETHIQNNARANYVLLARFARFADRLLTEDAMVNSTLTLLSEERRQEAQELVDEFYRQQNRG